MYGYHGRVTMVDLTRRSVWHEPLDEWVLRRFIGGIGLGTYLLYRHCPAGAVPLSGENPLIFATSPLAGSRLTTSNKFAVVTKSPLTGFIGDSLSSSYLATELKRTGSDALVITGRADRLTLLEVTDAGVDFLGAGDMAGLSTSETEEEVKARCGEGSRVACIGPAGESGVLYASIANDGGRQAGRTGPGAVMGSKNLKAIAVRGSTPAPAHDPQWLRNAARDLTRRSLGPATEKYRTLGTVANVSVFNRLGTLPTKNFQQSTFDDAEMVSGEQFVQAHRVRTAHCAGCTIGCEHIMTVNDDGRRSEGRLEYESAFALGPLLGIGDANDVLRASHACDELGMDTISAGVTLAWAMESVERGVLADGGTAGPLPRFGAAESVPALLELISRRDGIGGLLAQGSRRAAQAVGQGSDYWAMHVKGLEMPGYEPRSLKTMALGLAVSTRGACHNRSSAYEADFSARVDRLEADERRGRITADGEDYSAVMDSLTWCKFLRKAFDDFYAESAEIYEHLTGWQTGPDDLRRAGERINNLKKLFNIREGWTRDDDTLPPRVFGEKLTAGVVEGVGLYREDLDMMVRSYYRARGWDDDGLIPEGKLAELGLGDMASRAVPSGSGRA